MKGKIYVFHDTFKVVNMKEKTGKYLDMEELEYKQNAVQYGSLAMKIAICAFTIINFILKKSVYELFLIFFIGILSKELYRYKYSKAKEDMIAIIGSLIIVISILVLYLTQGFA